MLPVCLWPQVRLRVCQPLPLRESGVSRHWWVMGGGVHRMVLSNELVFVFPRLTNNFSSSSWVTDLSGLSLTGSVPGSSLIVKDECDFDSPQSLPSIDSGHSMQTIQHPPSSSRPPPTEAFVPPNLLPPAEASTSASSSAFPALAPGPGSKISYHCKQQHCVFAVHLVFNL